MGDHLAILAQRMAALDNGDRATAAYAAAPVTAPPPPAIALTIAEAAALVEVHPKTLAKWPLPFFKVGRVVRILRSDLDAFITSRRLSAKPEEN